MIKSNDGLTFHALCFCLMLLLICSSESQPFFKIQKNYTNGEQINGVSPYGNSFMIWTSAVGIWKGHVYNEGSGSTSFPFDSLNYIFNISDQTLTPKMTEYYQGNFFSLIQQEDPIYCLANINQNNMTGICHTWANTLVGKKYYMADIYDG